MSKHQIIQNEYERIYNHNITPSTSKFHLLPVNTTPSKLLSRVKNPFDSPLIDRLKKPLINSPLFCKISTPQKMSLPFEWTIEEVSELGPANLIACETQFLSTPDPDYEKKAQEAINLYFNENEIVPSPTKCSSRSNKIILADLDESNILNNNACKKNLNKRDGITQTELSFPLILPKHVEDVLANYFTFTTNQQQELHEIDSNITIATDYEARDASLRRKLFQPTSNNSNVDSDFSDYEVDLKHLSPVQSPELDSNRNFDSPELRRLNMSQNIINITPIKRESFGSLSPITKSISPKVRSLTKVKKKNDDDSEIYRSTPERITKSMSSSYLMETSDDINWKQKFDLKSKNANGSRDSNDFSFDEMQISHLSSQKNNTTPLRSKGRLTNRKNLSHSFSLFFDYELQNELRAEKRHQLQKNDEVEAKSLAEDEIDNPQQSKILECLPRTDSGFNECGGVFSQTNYVIENNDCFKLLLNDNLINVNNEETYQNNNYCDDESMRSINNCNNDNLICSTPSKIYF